MLFPKIGYVFRGTDQVMPCLLLRTEQREGVVQRGPVTGQGVLIPADPSPFILIIGIQSLEGITIDTVMPFEQDEPLRLIVAVDDFDHLIHIV